MVVANRLIVSVLSFFSILFVAFGSKANEIDRNLFGIHRSVSNGTYSFVKYNIGGPDYEVILTFDQNLGDIWELAFNPNTKLFYTYGQANYNSPSVLLEINASTATVTNLGQITVNIGNAVHPNICTADGLTFNQSTNELIGTVDIVCGSWRGFRVVKFNQNAFGTAPVTCTQIGTLNLSSNLEFDAIAMADNNALQGMDPDIPSNSLKFYGVTNVAASIGQISLKNSFNDWSTYRGIAFNKSEDKMYTFQGQNGMRWLVACDPSYASNAYNFQNVTQYNLTGFEIRGIVFGSISNTPLSVDNNDSLFFEDEKNDDFEVVVFPNPTLGSLEIVIDEAVDVHQIFVLDASGKLCYTANEQEILARKIDLISLSEGVYMLRVVLDKGKSRVIQIIKK